MKAPITFSLDTDADADLIRWLESQPERGRSAAIRDALRRGIGYSDDVTLTEVYQAVQDLRDLVVQMPARQGTNGQEQPGRQDAGEPADLAAALDGLGL
jgi:hypothetical protein